MTIDEKIKGEKLQHNINREAAQIWALLLGKIDTYEYFTDEEILPSDQSRIIVQEKFTNSPLGKAFEEQIKKQALEVLKPITKKLTIKDAIPENTLSEEAINELSEIEEI